MIRKCLAYCLMLWTLSSCSTYRIVENQITGKFERAGLNRHLKETNEFAIDYWDNGLEKPVIVLVHGFGSNAATQWFRQVRALSKTHRIIVPSLLYFSKSIPIGGTKYDLQTQVDLIQSLISSLNIESYSLCGVSYGGLVASEMTRQNPDQVEKLVLVDAPVKFYGQEDIDHVCSVYKVSKIEEFFVPHDHRGLKKLFRAGIQRPLPMPNTFLRGAYDAQYKPTAFHLRQLLTQLKSEETKYANMDYVFSCPVLLVWGEKDQIVRKENGRKLHHYLKGSKYVVFSRTKHFPNLEKPRAFNTLLVDFLNEGSA